MDFQKARPHLEKVCAHKEFHPTKARDPAIDMEIMKKVLRLLNSLVPFTDVEHS